MFVSNTSGQTNFLYLNEGAGRFKRVAVGDIANDGGNSRGCAWADYDADGYQDLFVTKLGPAEKNVLYRNVGGSNAWLEVRCVGVHCNRSAIGAKVRVKATIAGVGMWQMREISGGTGFGSQNSLDAHFGLADATKIERLRIEWPCGIVQEIPDVAMNQLLIVTEPPILEPGQGLTPAGFGLLLTSRGGFTYRIEASTNLTHWTVVTMLDRVNGSVPVVDQAANGFQRRFYRAVMP